jgi:hypothetical protein
MRGVEPVVLETITQQYPAQAASMLPEVTRITNDAAQKLGSNDQTAIPTSAMDCGRPLPLPLSAQSIGTQELTGSNGFEVPPRSLCADRTLPDLQFGVVCSALAFSDESHAVVFLRE